MHGVTVTELGVSPSEPFDSGGLVTLLLGSVHNDRSRLT